MKQSDAHRLPALSYHPEAMGKLIERNRISRQEVLALAPKDGFCRPILEGVPSHL